MMSSRRLASALVVCVLLVVAVVAVVDAARSGGADDRPGDPPTTPGGADVLESPASRLEAEAIEGFLYYSDVEDECRVHAVQLPQLAEYPPPKLRACRFDLPPEPGTGTIDSGVTWRAGDDLAATCAGGRIKVATRSGEPWGEIDGCAPAWKPDGTLSAIRAGEVWGTPCPGPEAYTRRACWRKLLSTAELTRAAHAVRFVPTGRRYLRSVTAIRVAWFSDTRTAALIRVRLRGRLRALGPISVLAIYEGTRLVSAAQYAGAFDLRISRERTFLGVIETGGQVAVVDERGRQLLGPGDLPSPRVHAVAFSPDEQWAAVASRWSVYLLSLADLAANRQPRIVRLPLAAGDLAWR